MLPIVLSYFKRLEALRLDYQSALNGLPVAALDWTPGPDMNSITVLATHTAESLRYWIGEVVGGEPANRDRVAEFQARGKDSATLIKRLDEVLAYSHAVLEKLTLANLEEPRTSQYRDHDFNVAWALDHTLVHVAQHLGHIEVTRQFWEMKSGKW
jgi:uncharacterized damage-inducible protein DinB